jgi:hypothetical protein
MHEHYDLTQESAPPQSARQSGAYAGLGMALAGQTGAARGLLGEAFLMALGALAMPAAGLLTAYIYVRYMEMTSPDGFSRGVCLGLAMFAALAVGAAEMSYYARRKSRVG